MVNAQFALLYPIVAVAVYHLLQHAWIATPDIIYPKELALNAQLLDAQVAVQNLSAPKPQQVIS